MCVCDGECSMLNCELRSTEEKGGSKGLGSPSILSPSRRRSRRGQHAPSYTQQGWRVGGKRGIPQGEANILRKRWPPEGVWTVNFQFANNHAISIRS